jgi:hypothetical protein
MSISQKSRQGLRKKGVGAEARAFLAGLLAGSSENIRSAVAKCGGLSDDTSVKDELLGIALFCGYPLLI